MKVKGLYQNSHGNWMFQPSSSNLPKGATRPKAIALGTKDKEAALRQIISLRGVDFRLPTRTVSEWGAIYVEEKVRSGQYRRTTESGVKLMLRVLVEFFGDRDPKRLDRACALEWFAWLSKGRTHATAHRYIRYAKAFFSWQTERRIVAENPFLKLRIPAPSQSRRDRFCSKQDRDKLLGSCTREDLRFVLMAGFYLGLRIKEIVECKWGWFTLLDHRGMCVVRNSDDFTTKNTKERQIPLHQDFVLYLKTMTPGKPDEYVLHPEVKQGHAHLRWDPKRPFTILTKSCGLEWVTFHTMRHTFGSLHSMAGTPEAKIRRWLGITQTVFDRHYAGLSPLDDDIHGI